VDLEHRDREITAARLELLQVILTALVVVAVERVQEEQTLEQTLAAMVAMEPHLLFLVLVLLMLAVAAAVLEITHGAAAIPLALVVLVVVVLVAGDQTQIQAQREQQILVVAVAVALMDRLAALPLEELAVPVSSLLVMLALKWQQAAQSPLLAGIPSTPLPLLAHLQQTKFMPHFAKVSNGIVTQVIVAEPEFFQTFVDPFPGEWIQTSYNTYGGVHANGGTPLRKNYAGIGYSYDQNRDAFIPPKPYVSWMLDEETCLWHAPTPYPNDGNLYLWDEATASWVLSE